MAYNKVDADGRTLIDLTSDTVTADTLVSGRTAHLASGEKVTGTFEPVTGVKGNAESTYRKGDVNLTPANIGAATSAQGTKADSAVQTIQIGGTTQTKTDGVVNLPAYPTKSSLGLGNVNNTSDLNKPISTAAQAALDRQQEQIDYNTNQGVKNRLKINIPEKTVKGLTFTPQSDGTIVINGTANVTSNSIVYWNLENPSNTTVSTQHSLNKIGYGNFIMSLNSDEEYMAGIAFQVLCYDTIIENPSVTSNIFVGESKSVTIDEDKKYVWLRLYISPAINGKTFDNFVFKPMIRDASIEDGTFESYAESNSRLTQKVDKALEQTGYNLLKLTNQTVTTNNVTFSVDGAAGTITATRTGTQTANAYLHLDVPDTVYGKLCLSGCADGGNANTYSVNPWDSTTNARPKNWEGTANAETSISASDYVEVNYVQGHTNRVTIRITPTASFTSLTFTPMIVPAELAGVPFQPYAKSNAELTQDLDDISEELDCLIIRAALVNNEVVIQNTSDFTNDLYFKYFSYTKPKFAILKLQITSNTYYYKALINSSSVSHGNLMEASFITVNGTYMGIYNFRWNFSSTVGTPTVSHTSLNLGS